MFSPLDVGISNWPSHCIYWDKSYDKAPPMILVVSRSEIRR